MACKKTKKVDLESGHLSCNVSIVTPSFEVVMKYANLTGKTAFGIKKKVPDKVAFQASYY